jgi:hypothetical protein
MLRGNILFCFVLFCFDDPPIPTLAQARMADELGIQRPTTFSQRDETGMTRAILPLLKKHNVTMISLGSGGSSGGHPKIPDIFVWRDEASDSEVLFAFDHGYGGGTHILPNGHALCVRRPLLDLSRPPPGPLPSVPRFFPASVTRSASRPATHFFFPFFFFFFSFF